MESKNDSNSGWKERVKEFGEICAKAAAYGGATEAGRIGVNYAWNKYNGKNNKK